MSNNPTSIDDRRADLDKIYKRLAQAIDRDTLTIAGSPEERRAFSLSGSLGLEGEPLSGVWATVEAPSALLIKMGEDYLRGEVPRASVVEAASSLLDAWKQGAREFKASRQASAGPVRR